MKNRLFLLCLVVVSILSSCVTPKDTNLLQEDVRKNYLPDFNQNNDYTIIPGDRLALQIYTLDEDMQKLFSAYTRRIDQGGREATNYSNELDNNLLNVYSDGQVDIPYLDRISVQGLSIFDAKNLIESRFQEFSPNITIDLKLQNRFFSVLGEAAQGRIAMPNPKITIFQALALAGNIDQYSNFKKVRIIRQTNEGTEVKTFDIRSKDIVNSEFYYIQPNDVIYVEQVSSFFFGRITSFTGILSIIGTLASVVGLTALIINLTK